MFVLERVYYPSWMMDVVFYVKTLVVKLTSRRLELFDQWNNLGAPVLSYYTKEELRRFLTARFPRPLLRGYQVRASRAERVRRRGDLRPRQGRRSDSGIGLAAFE